MTTLRNVRLYLPSMMFGLFALVRGVGVVNHWVSAAFLAALAVAYAGAERERKRP